MSDAEPDYKALYFAELRRTQALSFVIRDGWQHSIVLPSSTDSHVAIERFIVDGEVKLYEAKKQLAFLNARDFTVMATYKNQFATINAEPFWTVKAIKIAISSAFCCPPPDAPRHIGRVFYFFEGIGELTNNSKRLSTVIPRRGCVVHVLDEGERVVEGAPTQLDDLSYPDACRLRGKLVEKRVESYMRNSVPVAPKSKAKAKAVVAPAEGD